MPALPIFRFSQLEVPWALGPPDGRYLVRAPGEAEFGAGEVEMTAGAATHVLVFATLGAPRRRGRLAARQRAAAPEPDPAPVTTARVTVIDAAKPLADAAAAKQWLAGAGEDDLEAGLSTLEYVLQTFRAVTADPYVHAPAREQLLVARVGYGDGEQVAYGQWSEARELLVSAPRSKRSKVLEPQARLAAALSRRSPALLCEELVLRARLDYDARRSRSAALQLTVALDAALSELDPGMAFDMATRIDELASRIEQTTNAAAAALRRELDGDEQAALEFTLGRIEAALRARAVASA